MNTRMARCSAYVFPSRSNKQYDPHLRLWHDFYSSNVWTADTQPSIILFRVVIRSKADDRTRNILDNCKMVEY